MTEPTSDEPGATDRGAAPGRRRKWLWRLGQLVLIVAVVAGVRAWQQRGTADGPAPPLEGRTLAGDPVSLAKLRGEPVLVHFWATWCGVCDMMDASVADVAGDHRVVTVASWSEGASRVRAHLESRGLEMPVVPDPDGRLAEAYGVASVPTSFVLGPDGQIAHTEVGYTTELGLRARLWLAGR